MENNLKVNRLPIYEIIIDPSSDTQGVSMISLVGEPAIGVNFIKLAKEEIKEYVFSAQRDKQLLFGPFLIPNQLIYRQNDQMGEYMVKFSKESIQLIADKFNSDLNSKNINFQHSNVKVDGYVSQNWIIDDGNDKSKNYNFDLPEGTWFGGVKVKDEKFWDQEVKTDFVRGFSVEISGELELVMSKNKQNKMEDNKEIVTNLAVPATPEADASVDTTPADTGAPATPATPAPVATAEALTAESVMQMIDIKFQSLNDEILAIREELNKMVNPEPGSPEAQSKENQDTRFTNLSDKVKAIEEKLAATPGAPSIKKNIDAVLDDKFNAQVDRLRKFAKVKPI